MQRLIDVWNPVYSVSFIFAAVVVKAYCRKTVREQGKHDFCRIVVYICFGANTISPSTMTRNVV